MTENGLSQQSLVYFTTFCQILPMKFNVTEELNYTSVDLNDKARASLYQQIPGRFDLT